MTRRSIAAVTMAAALGAAPAAAVVGGTRTSRAKFPYFAVVGNGCGGALIAPDRVLTAAHCRGELGDPPMVRVGPRSELRRVRLVALSPVYVRWQKTSQRENPPGPGDLMLLQLDRPVRDVTPVRLARRAPSPGTRVVAIGRGATDPQGGGQGVFREGAVQVFPSSSCAEQLTDAAQRQWSLCTRDPRQLSPSARPPFVSACFGDSGGPLLAGGVDVGAVSWGPACGTERDPEIYGNVARGRAFALAPRPIWAPESDGLPRVVGAARVGSTVRCVVRWLQPPVRATYSFFVGGFQKQSGFAREFRIPSSARGKLLQCAAAGATAGGRGATQNSRGARVG